MNMSKKPFQDKRVREAFNYAINKEALCKVAFAGYADPATGYARPPLISPRNSVPGPMIRRRPANS